MCEVVEAGGGIMRWDFVDLLLRKSTIKEQKSKDNATLKIPCLKSA